MSDILTKCPHCGIALAINEEREVSAFFDGAKPPPVTDTTPIINSDVAIENWDISDDEIEKNLAWHEELFDD